MPRHGPVVSVACKNMVNIIILNVSCNTTRLLAFKILQSKKPLADDQSFLVSFQFQFPLNLHVAISFVHDHISDEANLKFLLRVIVIAVAVPKNKKNRNERLSNDRVVAFVKWKR